MYDELRFRKTWAGRRFLSDAVKYVVVACVVTGCILVFTSSLGPQHGYFHSSTMDSELDLAHSGNPLLGASALHPRHYVKGPPTAKFRDNLRDEYQYLTSWNYAGMTNEFVTHSNILFLAYMSHRIPILPPLIPNTGHLPKRAAPMRFSEVYDLPRLRETLRWPIIEWSDVKKAKYDDVITAAEQFDTPEAEKELLGCWGAQQAFDKNNRPMGALAPLLLNLEIVYTPVPFFAKLKPRYKPDTHVGFGGLASLLRPLGRKAGISTPEAKTNHTSLLNHLKDTELAPDDHMACFDNLYYAGNREQFEFQERDSPAWNLIGTELRFNPKMELLAEGYLKKVFGRNEVPLYIAAHIRRADFKLMCKGAATKDCFAPLSTYANHIKQVQEELRKEHGPSSPRGSVKEVLVSSDEEDPSFWKEVRDLGWRYVDHEAMHTVETLSPWHPSILDIIIQSRAAGFVGTDKSTLSLVSARRVKDWNGGPSRMVKWGKK